jgi:putative tryptophan/tyrosine transport system substrate-binding protein
MTWAFGALLLSSVGVPGQATVVVAVESGVEAYEAAVAGLGEALSPNGYRVVDVRSGGAGLAQAASAKDVQLVVAVGSGAFREACAHKLGVPVVATMMLNGSELEGRGHVDLDIPLGPQLQAMRALWPQRLRVGIIRNPGRSRLTAEALEAQARKEGFSAVVLECSGPARLLKVVAEEKGKIDFLLCFPDPDLYNPVTIKPFVLASLEARLPIVGFSPAFVHAGAAAGIYPDYREVGRQTGEMALRCLHGDGAASAACGEEGPRKIQVAVNLRVARLLGAEFHTEALPVEVFR